MGNLLDVGDEDPHYRASNLNSTFGIIIPQIASTVSRVSWGGAKMLHSTPRSFPNRQVCEMIGIRVLLLCSHPNDTFIDRNVMDAYQKKDKVWRHCLWKQGV